MLSVLIFSPVLVLTLLSPVLRYRKGSHLERQQIKWLALFGMLLVVGTILGFVVYPLITGGQMFNRENNLFSLIFFSSMSLFPPLVIGLAVLRYHLWDIDIIIRRTLVYGALTVTLAVIFFGSVVLLQELIGRISGTQKFTGRHRDLDPSHRRPVYPAAAAHPARHRPALLPQEV